MLHSFTRVVVGRYRTHIFALHASYRDRGEIFLLQWLHTVEKALAVLPEDVIRSAQTTLQSALLSILTQAGGMTSPAPRPGRPIRAAVARDLVLLLRRGDQRPLFDCVQTLVRAFAAPKAPDKENRV